MEFLLLTQNDVETVVHLSKGNISSQNVRVDFSLKDIYKLESFGREVSMNSSLKTALRL